MIPQPPLFVHSKVDEAGLSPSRFRVLAHLRRRGDNDTGQCNPGIPKMAEICCMSEKTVKAALKELTVLGIVQAEAHRGLPNSYSIDWGRFDTRVLNGPHPKRTPGTGGKTPPHHPLPKDTPEGNPVKVIQEGDPRRARNPLFDALISIDGSDPSEATKGAARACGVALADIQAVAPDLTPAEIQSRAKNYRSHFENAALTPSALAKHWATCANPSARAAAKKTERSQFQHDDYSKYSR